MSTPSAISSHTMSSSMAVTKPYTPEVVMTSSPSPMERVSCCWACIRRFCGRIMRK